MNKKKNIMIIVGIIAFILIIGGISYSYFVYNKDVGNVSLNTGEISIDFSNTNGDKTLTNVMPMSDIDGKNNSDYFDFTVNSTVDTEKIYYEVYILPKTGNTLDTSYLKTYLTDQSNNEIERVRLFTNLQTTEKDANGKIIYKGVIELNNDHTTKTESKDFRLRMWLDENYSGQTSKTFEFDIYLYAKNVAEDYEIRDGDILLRRAIKAKEADTNVQCSNITYEEEDEIYLSGTSECIDMNYVWYSGKLWRVTAIYPDGAMKLLTQNIITTIAFNESGQLNYYTDANTTSYLYKWLNEEFYDTLYNPTSFIDTTKQWNTTLSESYFPVSRPAEINMVSGNVGTFNSYELNNSYRCIGNDNCTGNNSNSGYLNIGYGWWLINIGYNTLYAGYADADGSPGSTPPQNLFAVRPAIYIKSGVEFTGDGTVNNPYKIVGDKETGVVGELINNRLSGEYVKIVNPNNLYQYLLFRIVGVEDNKAKIITAGYTVGGVTYIFATAMNGDNTYWGRGTTTDSGTWYTYLNGYYSYLESTFGELFDSGTYYLGTPGYNYKLGVCANTTSGNTRVCDKTSDKGTFNIGISRFGEMFSTQPPGGSSNAKNMWLMNRGLNSDRVWNLSNVASFAGYSSLNNKMASRATLFLKSTVKIQSGSGTEQDPYVVGL